MLPDLWLSNARIKKLRVEKFPSQPKSAYLALANKLFGTQDLTKSQVSQLIKSLSESDRWPGDVKVEVDLGMTVENLTVTEDTTPDWLLGGLLMLLEVQPGSSVLDLGCGNGTLAQALPQKVYYEGYDINPDLIREGRSLFGPMGHQFHAADLTTWLTQEPDTTYNMVYLDGPRRKLVPASEKLCLETQMLGVVDLEQALVEQAAKCTAKAGMLVTVTEHGLTDEVRTWLDRRGVMLAELHFPDMSLVVNVCRVGSKRGAPHTLAVSFEGVGFQDEFLAWCAEQESIRVSVSSEDPRPMMLKAWDIQVVPNTGPGYGNTPTGVDALLFKTKHGVGIRWASPEVAMAWAQHQALTAPREETWAKTAARFNDRLKIEPYLTLRDKNLSHVLNLADRYAVVEEAALAKHLDRRSRKYERLELSYPEKSTIDNRYYTLGPGSTLVKDDKPWRVVFSEPDFSNSRPPKVHIEQV